MEQLLFGRIETTIKEELYKKVFRPHDMGHIASLAVNQNFRGLGSYYIKPSPRTMALIPLHYTAEYVE